MKPPNRRPTCRAAERAFASNEFISVLRRRNPASTRKPEHPMPFRGHELCRSAVQVLVAIDFVLGPCISSDLLVRYFRITERGGRQPSFYYNQYYNAYKRTLVCMNIGSWTTSISKYFYKRGIRNAYNQTSDSRNARLRLDSSVSAPNIPHHTLCLE